MKRTAEDCYQLHCRVCSSKTWHVRDDSGRYNCEFCTARAGAALFLARTEQRLLCAPATDGGSGPRLEAVDHVVVRSNN